MYEIFFQKMLCPIDFSINVLINQLLLSLLWGGQDFPLPQAFLGPLSLTAQKKRKRGKYSSSLGNAIKLEKTVKNQFSIESFLWKAKSFLENIISYLIFCPNAQSCR